MNTSDNQYILKWREHVLKAAEALKNHDYETYESEMHAMENVYEEYKKDEALSYKDETTFGAANDIFESALPNLFVKNQSAVRDFVKTVREDKNLQAQFMFYETLKEYKEEYDRSKYLEEAVKLALEKINPKTIKESNAKLYKILKEYNIKPLDYLNEDNLIFYRLCETIFSSPKSLANLSKLNETFNRVAEKMEEHAKVNQKKIDETQKEQVMTIEEFVNKCNINLTESEKTFLSTLFSPTDENQRRELFEKQRNECLLQLENLMTESNDSSTMSRLDTLLGTVKNKNYNKETVLEDIVKIMEISEILNS